MHLDATCDLVLVSRMLRSLHYLSCGWVVGWVWTLKLMLSQPKLKLELELGLSLAKRILTGIDTIEITLVVLYFYHSILLTL